MLLCYEISLGCEVTDGGEDQEDENGFRTRKAGFGSKGKTGFSGREAGPAGLETGHNALIKQLFGGKLCISGRFLTFALVILFLSNHFRDNLLL